MLTRVEIPGYARKYLIDSAGTIFNSKGRTMVGWRNKSGYRCVALRTPGTRKCYLVHRLVLLSFVGPCPEGKEGRHLDGNSLNNSLSNLSWSSKRENERDKLTHGTRLVGERATCYKGKLSSKDVISIRERIAEGASTRELAEEYKLTKEYLRDVVNGRKWKHLKGAVKRQRRTGKILSVDR